MPFTLTFVHAVVWNSTQHVDALPYASMLISAVSTPTKRTAFTQASPAVKPRYFIFALKRSALAVVSTARKASTVADPSCHSKSRKQSAAAT